MAASRLPALARAVIVPDEYRCCLCRRPNASRGFPNDVWYCAPCVPPPMRFPWEAGYEPPADSLFPAAPIAAAPAQAALDLTPGHAPA